MVIDKGFLCSICSRRVMRVGVMKAYLDQGVECTAMCSPSLFFNKSGWECIFTVLSIWIKRLQKSVEELGKRCNDLLSLNT